MRKADTVLRVCVIGMGPIGNRHADVYVEDALAELVGVCDIRRDRADVAAGRLGVRGFYDAREMLDALQPDVCSVTTGGYEYGSDHHEPTMQALAAGCDVLCEKPISNEIDKGCEMVSEARRCGRRLGVNLNTASRRRRVWPGHGSTKGGWDICCSST